MKNSVIFLFIVFPLIESLKEEKIINAWSKDTKGSNTDSARYPITGKDYWVSKPLNRNEFADWTCELDSHIIIRQIYIEFNTPPDKMIIFSSVNSTSHFLPIAKYNYATEINFRKKNRRTLYFYNKPTLIDIHRTTPYKYLKLRLISTSNQGLNINMIKVKVYSDMKGSNSYLLSRLTFSPFDDSRPEQMCLKYSRNIFSLVPCRECLLYQIKSCSFQFEESAHNGTGLVFSNKESGIRFSIQNIYSDSKDDNKQDVSNEIDYEKEIVNVSTNSTINKNFDIKNIFDIANNNYWSSTLSQKPNCDSILINITLSNEQIIKDMFIHWINKPERYKIDFIPETKQKETINWRASENNQMTSLKKINIRAKNILIYLGFDNDRGEKRVCISSIKKIRLYKNEIVFNANNTKNILNTFYPIQLSPDDIHKLLYSQLTIEKHITKSNFYFTKLNELNRTMYDNIYKKGTNIINSLYQNELMLKYAKFQKLKEILYEKMSYLILKTENKYGSDISLSLPLTNNKTQPFSDPLNELSKLLKTYSEKEGEVKKMIYDSLSRNEALQNDLNSFIIYNTSHYPDMMNYDIINKSFKLSENYHTLSRLFAYSKDISRLSSSVDKTKNILYDIYSFDINSISMMTQFLNQVIHNKTK